jgi:hypothetical protein
LKSFLSLSRYTPTAPLLWELGLHPLITDCFKFTLKYLGSILDTPTSSSFIYPPSVLSSIRSPTSGYRRELLLSSFNQCSSRLASLEKCHTSPFRRTWVFSFVSHLTSVTKSTFSPSILFDANTRTRIIDAAYSQAESILDKRILTCGSVSQFYNSFRPQFSYSRSAQAGPGYLYYESSLSPSRQRLVLHFRLSNLRLSSVSHRRSGSLEPPPTCPCCDSETPETETHFLLQCPLFSELRTLHNSVFDEVSSLADILRRVDCSSNLALSDFLRAAFSLRDTTLKDFKLHPKRVSPN